MPDDERQWVIDAAKTIPGVLNAYHLVDSTTGNGMSIAFYDDDVDVAEVKTAIASKAEEIGWYDDRALRRPPRPSTGCSGTASSVRPRQRRG